MLGHALAILFTLCFTLLFIFRVEDRGESLPHYSGNERVWLYLTPFALALHTTVACFTMGLGGVTPWRAVAAFLLLAVSLSFWFWGRVLIGPIRMTRTPDQPPLEFRRDGAFGIVRHPLYAALVVYMTALAVGAWASWTVVTYLLAVAGICVRAVHEERRLREQLGAEYEEYSRHVPRLIPFVW